MLCSRRKIYSLLAMPGKLKKLTKATVGAISASVLSKTSHESLGDTILYELDSIPQLELYPVRKDCV